MSEAADRPTCTKAAHVLIIDDDEELCELLALRLEAHGYRTSAVHDGLQALARVAQDPPAAALLDLRLGEQDGLDILVQMLRHQRHIQVLILTAHGSIETAVEAMRRGAQGFLTKPFRDHELLEKLAEAVDRAAEVATSEPASRTAPLLIGESAVMQRLREQIGRVATTEATILITGESGTGKELVARSLHDLSRRRAGPFVALNCGALPPELLTSELFGHVKGAFTGATRDREGVFGAARGGTLFLDEIGEAPHGVQVRLLRVLQEQRYTPVGATSERSADVRIVTATNRDLYAEVAAKRFREDLYYRLRVVPLELPPLRERGSDIELLAKTFVTRAAARHKLPAQRLTPAALALLRAHKLPGNVRQLYHAIEAAVLLAESSEIDAPALSRLLTPEEAGHQADREGGPNADVEPPAPQFTTWLEGGQLPPMAEVRREVERLYLVEVLRRARGNVSAAAKMAGRHRTDFYELLRRHNLTGSTFR